jgi:uncharacterized protein
MKSLSILLSFLFIPLQILLPQEENLTGNWLGTLKISTVELRVVFKITKNETGSLKAVLDSPDQGAFGIAVDSVVFKDPYVKFTVPAVNGFFEGDFQQDSIVGKWTQGMPIPLVLKKSEEILPPKRPQEPKEPFPYTKEDVTYENKDAGLTLAGTFTYPENAINLPAVILISGSGPQNRNEELLGHKPFLVLADHLTRNGIAVLRFDDRGIGGSTGDFSKATTKDFVTDAIAGVEYLKSRKEVDKNKIGLIGHSEGGLIAPLAAVQDDNIDFIVLMAGPGMSGKEILRLQTALIMRVNGADEESIKSEVETSMEVYDIVINMKDTSAAKEKIRDLFEKRYSEMSEEEKAQLGDGEKYFNQQMKTLFSPWFRFFLEYDPYETLTKVDVPVLAINGEKDLQVPPEENLDLIEKALNEGGNENFITAKMEGLNHLFQKSETGSPGEYSKIEETMSPEALNLISGWIKEITK